MDRNLKKDKRTDKIVTWWVFFGIVVLLSFKFILSPPSNSNATTTIYNLQNLPQTEQNVLNFTLPNHSSSISTLIEATLGYSSWIGSDSIPGAIQVIPAPHGASDVDWTIKDLTGLYYGKKGETIIFKFQISQNGNYLSFENEAASDVNNFLGQY